MARWKLKGCPKCGGDLALEDDGDGVIGWKCLLCSKVWSTGRLELLEAERLRLERERWKSPPEGVP